MTSTFAYQAASRSSFANGWHKNSLRPWFPADKVGLEQDKHRQKMDSNYKLTLGDIDNRWEYRAGWPRLIPAPLTLAGDDRGIDMEALSLRIYQILDCYQISRQDEIPPQLLNRTHQRYISNPPPAEHLRVVVDCVYDPEQQKKHPNSWSMAVIEIHDAIHELVGPCDIGIELYDSVYEDSIHFAEVPAECKDTLMNWDGGHKYRQQVLALFENQPRLWQAMVLIGRKASNQHTKDHRCVLWFDAIDTSHILWPQLEKELASILPQDISIEIWQASNQILCGRWAAAASTTKDSCDLDKMELTPQIYHTFERPPKPGFSLGVVGEDDRSGTLGGYITVSKNTVDSHGNSTPCERIYALTCAHVALGNSPLFQTLDSKGRVSFDENVDSVPMQSPSKVDCDRGLAKLKPNIKSLQLKISNTKADIGHLREINDDDGCKRLETLNNKLSSDLGNFQREENMARENRYLGDVRAAAFGKRAHKNPNFRDSLAMDIALIDVTKSISNPQIPLEDDFPNLSSVGAFESWEADSLANRVPNDSNDKTNNNNKVAKFGRTSGFTEGILHGITADINFKYHGKSHEAFSAWTVYSPISDPLFASPGDSGAFVFHVDSLYDGSRGVCVAGILIGTSMKPNFSYFVPFDAVVEEVEALTGGKVAWPVKREPEGLPVC